MSDQEIQVFSGFEDLLPIEEYEEHPEIFMCLDYLLMRESDPRPTMDQITDMMHNKHPSMPTTRPGLYYKIEVWRRDGTLRKAEELFIAPKVEEMRAVIGEAVSAMPAMIRNLIKQATDTERSGKTALEIVQFLGEMVREQIDHQKQPGSEERSYAKRPVIFDPTEIVEE